jgi:Ca2+-binding EF-hand superfamily protein
MFSRILTSVEQIKATPLSKKELLDGFVTYGVFLNDEEQSSLLAQVNANERGQIALGTFLTALRGVMSPQRAEFVVQIYDVMYGAAVNSVVTFEDMMKSFCPAQHPEVLCGNKTARQMIVEFQQAWNKTGSDRVSYEEFAEYFEDLSAAIENDDYFEMLVSNTWGLTNLCHNNFSSIAFRSQG